MHGTANFEITTLLTTSIQHAAIELGGIIFHVPANLHMQKFHFRKGGYQYLVEQSSGSVSFEMRILGCPPERGDEGHM